MLRRRPGRFTAILTIGVVGLAVSALRAPAAAAHSALEESTPAAGAVVPSSPDRISLRFNEPVSLPDDAVRLLDADGEDVRVGAARVVDTEVSVSVDRRLPDGSYIVAWKVRSEDAHPVSGAFTFAVGAPSAAVDEGSVAAIVAAARPDTTAEQVLADVAAGLAYAGVLGALGAAWFLVGPARDQPRLRMRSVRMVVGMSAAAGMVGLVAGVIGERLLIDEVTGAMQGQALLGSAGLVVAFVSVRWSDALTLGGRRLLVAAASVSSIVAFTLVGHTRTASPVALTIASDLAHLTAAAVWTGGLVALLCFLRSSPAHGPADGAADESAGAPADVAVVAAFSRAATVSVVVVILAGAVMGWRIVGSWSALTGTDYGVLLLVKLGLVGVVAAIGAYNHVRLVGRAATGALRRTLLAEAVLVIAVLAVTATLTSTSPNETDDESASGWTTGVLTCQEAAAMEGMPGMEDMDHDACVGTTTSSLVPFDPTAGAGAEGGAVSETGSFGTGTALVTVTPGRVGPNTVTVSLTDADGAPIELEEPPTIELRLRERQIGPLVADAERVGPGSYRLRQELVLAGAWEINVSAVVSDFEQPQAIVTLDVTG